MTRTDALAVVGLALIFVGTYTVWPSAAIILLGVLLLALSVGLALLRRKGAAGEGSREG